MAKHLWAALGLAAAATGVAAQDYGQDPAFNGGRYYVDAFAGSAQASYRGKALVRLADGAVVVAGIVPGGAGSGALGLVRYDAAGVRQAWTNPGVFGSSGNQYVTYEPASLAPRPLDDVKDIVAFGDRLFVLAETQRYSLSPVPPFLAHFSGHAVDVLVFGTDGAYLGSESVIDDDGDERTVFGGGIAVYGNGLFPETVSLVYGGTSVENGTRRATFRRYTVGSDSSLAAQTGVVYPNPGNFCSAPQHCDIAGIALGGRTGGTGAPRIYLGGSHYDGNWDFMAMRLDANGVPVTSFGGTGVREFGFNIAGGTLDDGGRAIAVKPGGVLGGNSDEIYVAGDVAVNCGDGVGIAKWTATGDRDLTFGPGGFGAVRYGDTYVAPGGICFLGTAQRYAHGLALDDGKLALVGQTNRASIIIGGELQVDAFFSVVDAATGDLEFSAEFPYRENGTRARHSGLWAVAGGSGAFTATGDVRYTASATGGTAGMMQYATTRFVWRPDRIFANGFQ